MNLRLQKINVFAFISIYTLVFAYIWFKAINVPMTHDEVATTVHYSNFSYWKIMMYPDAWPNNHILNTLFSKLFISIFGAEQWAVRLPNVLSFLLFAIGAYRILIDVISKHSRFFIPAALLFVASPYMLDFFSLCRGYGMSVALCVFSVSYLIRGFKLNTNKHIWLSLVFAILASYANFTLLVFWLAISALAWFYFLVRKVSSNQNFWKPTLALFIVNAGYLALIANPVYKMQSTNQFEYWTSNGFFSETIYPLVQNSKYDSRVFLTTDFLAWFSVALLVLNLVFVFLEWKRKKFSLIGLTNPLAIGTLVLTLTAGINILQCWILNTPNLNGRTALFFYPLFVIALLSSHALFRSGDKYHIKKSFAVLMTVFFAHHIIHTMKPNSVREWSYDANTFEVLDHLESQSGEGEVSLDVNWLFHPSFTFYEYTDKSPWLKLGAYSKEINPNSESDFYYVQREDYPILEGGYGIERDFPNGCLLLKRIQ